MAFKQPERVNHPRHYCAHPSGVECNPGGGTMLIRLTITTNPRGYNA